MKKTLIISGCVIKVNLSKNEIKKIEQEEKLKIQKLWDTNKLD